MARTRRREPISETEMTTTPKRKKPEKVIVNVSNLNVRKDHSYDAPIARTVPAGTVFEVFSEYDGWGQVGEYEWVALKFTKSE